MARACAHCNRSTNASDPVARAEGWRWYDGPTMGGGRLVDIVCPYCSGVRVPGDDQDTWDAGCDACDWSYSADKWADDEPLNDAREARRVALDHTCEPRVWISNPGGQMFDPNDFDLDGKPRKGSIAAIELARLAHVA